MPEEPAGASRFFEPDDLRRLHSFELAARIMVDGFYAGRRRSPFYDVSAEVADYRPYTPGDDLRSLDWRAYARTDRDIVRLTRKDTDMKVRILLDTSASMGFNGQMQPAPVRPSRFRLPGFRRGPASGPARSLPLTKLEYACYLAAAISLLVVRQGDQVGLARGGARLEAFVPPGRSRNHWLGLLRELDNASPAGDTQMPDLLRAHFPLSRGRGLLVVLSDFLDDPLALYDALGIYTARGWRVALFQLLTTAELRLPGERERTLFLDPEGSGRLDADPATLAEGYRALMRGHMAAMRAGAAARGIEYALFDTAAPYFSALERFLETRSRAAG